MKHSVPHPEDDQLVEALISNNQEAWTYFIEKHLGLLKYILRETGIPSYDLDDATSDLLIKLILTIENYNPNKASLNTWLHSVTRNFAIDWMRVKEFKNRKNMISIEAMEEKHSGYTETHIRRSLPRGSNVDPRSSRITRIIKENFNERQVKLIFLKSIMTGYPGRKYQKN
ncbi:RNA polymerase sigma factor [Desulfitobacterium hafniense]|uniref:RNA polymerase sigma factor, region 2 n=1 Tax=Desulfitobacterium hafniense TaxID=49338 RepID=A0A098AZ28_DESHA|nr:sigma-70 family RNA polymerase sigma factor [Desulfitobacterium hafniense]CDX00876.1 RNA polymerase sigma factor, region 2 [Desulfitobacterium hafniense]